MKNFFKWSALFLLPVVVLTILGTKGLHMPATLHPSHLAPLAFLPALSTLGTNVLTMADLYKRQDPDGSMAEIIELLHMNNGMLEDMLWQEGNQPTGHRTTVRTSLPSVSWRKVNQGVTPSKSTTAQIEESLGTLEAWSEVDVLEAKLSGNPAAYRASEAAPFVEAMSQELASTILYGNQNLEPETFSGFAPRYTALGQNVLSGGGSGADNSSIWVVGWGAQTVFGVVPKGLPAGIHHEDLGIETVETTAGIAGNRMRAYREFWQWYAGLVVRDWRFVVRIANIDISVLIANSAPADLTLLMTKALYRLPNMTSGRVAIYMNRTVAEFLDIQRSDTVQSGGGITYENVDGKTRMSFRGIPIRIVDSILETEAAVS